MLRVDRKSSLDSNISRWLSKSIRHVSDKLNLTLDAYGRVPMQELVEALNTLLGQKILESFGHLVTESEVIAVIDAQDPENLRHSWVCVEGKILVSCFQGHAAKFYEPYGPIKFDCIWEEITTPIKAFHNTKAEFLESILLKGLMFTNPLLKPTGEAGRFVHMYNADSEKKGRLHSTATVEVDMGRAMANGVRFFMAGNGVIIATEPVPADCLSVVG